jgi:hypothetical protein
MAEVTGQFGSEYIELNNAATEATLKDLVKSVKVMSAKLGKGAMSEKELKRFFTEISKSGKIIRSNTDEERKRTAALKNGNKTIGDETSARDKSSKSIEKSQTSFNKFGQNVLDVGASFFNLASELANMGDSLGSAASVFGKIPVAGGLLQAVFGSIAGSAEKLFSAFQTSASVGATFGGSITAMVRASSDAGLTFDQFSNIIAKNSQGLALLGNGVDSGAKRFAVLSKNMRTSLTAEGLANLGYSAETANSAMAGYVSRLAKTGQAQGMTTSQLTKSSTNYLKNLDALSKLTGESKDTLQAQADALQNEAKFRSLLSKADKGSRDELEKLMLSVPKGMQAGAMEVLATGTATTEAGQQFLAFMNKSGQAFIATGEKVRRGGQLTEDANKELINGVTAEAGALAKSPLGDTLSMFVPEMNAFMVSAHDASERAKNFAELRGQTDKAAAEAIDGMAASVVNAKMQIAEFSNEISVLLASNMPMFMKAITLATDFIGGPFISILETVNKHFGKMVIGIGALLAAMAVSSVAGMMGGGSDAGKGKAGKGKGKAGKGGAGDAGGFGGGIGRNIAAGLSAFANPKVLIGATVIAGVITVIGAAIAGAAWLTGKALPTFSQGLKSFETIDGSKLSAVGKGMVGLAAGIAAFGAGGAIGAFGNIAANLVSGIDTLFGGKTPFDKLAEFSKLQFNAERVKVNAEALGAFGSAMSKFGVGGGASAVGGALEGIFSFFSGGSTISKLQKQIIEFQSLSIDRAKVVSNSEGLKAFVSAMSVASSDLFFKSLKSLSTLTTGGFFSKSPLEKLDQQIVQFQNLSINKDKIVSTADGLRSFVKSITEISSAKMDISSTLKLEKGIRELRDMNKELQSYKKNLEEIKKQSVGTVAEAPSTSTSADASTSQDQTGSLVNSLNSKLDQLIAISASIKDINSRQLRAQENSDPMYKVS